MKDIVITTVTKRLTDEHRHEYINAKWAKYIKTAKETKCYPQAA